MRRPPVSEPPAVAASPTPTRGGAPALQGARILALQRTHGNRRVARAVHVELRQAPPRPNLGPAVDRTTSQNRRLAEDIDALAPLDDRTLADRRLELQAKVAGSDGDDHARLLQTLDAIEYE